MANRQKPHKRDLRLYKGLSIELDSVDAYLAKGPQQNPGEIEKWLVVKNGDMPVKECQVVVEDLEYYFKSEWIFPPNGFEQKALRWAEESDSQEGKIDICANGSATLEIARLFRFPNPFFGISYFDGSYGKTHHLVGTYKLRLRIEAKIGNGSSIWGFEPIIYEVYLSYVDALNLEIEDIVRVSAT
jgi:hypothetical protein